jgi:two-component SAPR family response regulator
MEGFMKNGRSLNLLRFNRLINSTVMIVTKRRSFSEFLKIMSHELSAKEIVLMHDTNLALRYLKQSRCDIILLDEESFPLSSDVFAKYMRSCYSGPNLKTPIILMSLHENIPNYTKVLNLDYIQNVLPKPFQIKDLNDSVGLTLNTQVTKKYAYQEVHAHS